MRVRVCACVCVFVSVCLSVCVCFTNVANERVGVVPIGSWNSDQIMNCSLD